MVAGGEKTREAQQPSTWCKRHKGDGHQPREVHPRVPRLHVSGRAEHSDTRPRGVCANAFPSCTLLWGHGPGILLLEGPLALLVPGTWAASCLGPQGLPSIHCPQIKPPQGPRKEIALHLYQSMENTDATKAP